MLIQIWCYCWSTACERGRGGGAWWFRGPGGGGGGHGTMSFTCCEVSDRDSWLASLSSSSVSSLLLFVMWRYCWTISTIWVISFFLERGRPPSSLLSRAILSLEKARCSGVTPRESMAFTSVPMHTVQVYCKRSSIYIPYEQILAP